MRSHRFAVLALAPLAAILLSVPPVAAQVNITVNGALGDLDGNGDMGAGEAAVLQAVVNCWAARVGTARNFTLNVMTAGLTGGTIGQGSSTAFSGAGVPTAGRITMDNDGSTTYFVDPTPLVNGEFTPDPLSPWRFTGGPNSIDLFAVVAHEVGHAMGWICGSTCGRALDNPNYEALMNPPEGSFVSNTNCAPNFGNACGQEFPLLGQPALAGCVQLQAGGGHPYNVPLRGDGLGGSGSSTVNELSHPGIGSELMLGFYRCNGVRELPSVNSVDLFAHAYGDAVNLPLTVNAGADVVSECNAVGGSNVTLNGGGSNDPEGNPLTFSWSCPSVSLSNANTATPAGFFALGPTVTCRLDATDLAACPPDADTVAVRVQDTTDPNVNCPSDITVECRQTGGTPDSDPGIATFLGGATATDVCDASLSIFDNAPSFFGVGVSTVVTFSTLDDSGNNGSCMADVTVVDTTAPDMTCPADITVECTQTGGTPASHPDIAAFLGGATATDICDPGLSISNNAPAFFGVGASTGVTFSTQDDFANGASCMADVTVVDTTPPVIASVTATPSVLWPPNHKMVGVTVGVSVADVCDAAASCRIISITSNEPVNDRGDGNTAPDWEITGPLTAKLRAERSGRESGRVYTLTVMCTDDFGNGSAKTVEVRVPHDQR